MEITTDMLNFELSKNIFDRDLVTGMSMVFSRNDPNRFGRVESTIGLSDNDFRDKILNLFK